MKRPSQRINKYIMNIKRSLSKICILFIPILFKNKNHVLSCVSVVVANIVSIDRPDSDRLIYRLSKYICVEYIVIIS